MKNWYEIIFSVCLFLVTRGNAQNNFIIKGTGNIVDTEVTSSRTFSFGTNWSGITESAIMIVFEQNKTTINPIGEPSESFHFIPEGSGTSVEILFNSFPINSLPPFIFTVSSSTPSLVLCSDKIRKVLPTNQIIIVSGNTSCNGQYIYRVTVGGNFDTATSNILFSGGTQPNFVELDQVTSLSANTFYGLLGTTFQTAIGGTRTISINATDFEGEPRGNIQWFFIDQATQNRIGLPGSLAGVTIDDSQSGTSILRINGITGVHLGEYIAVATNVHGIDTASAFITQGVAPFIIAATGQSSTDTFRVGAARAVTLGGRAVIRAEDRQSDPSAVTTWSYSRTALGPYSPISSGGAYSIASQSGTGNVGTDSALTITNVQDAQLGYYRAQAVNAHGTSTSALSLVGRSPEIREGSGVVAVGGSADIGASFTGLIGSTVTIVSEDIEGFPQSNYQWQRIDTNGAITNVVSGGRFNIVNSVLNGRLRSTLTITGVRQEDLGTYRVTATNGLTPNDIVQSLVGTGSTCRNGTIVTRVTDGARVQSAGYFDTFGATSFSIEATDTNGIPQGTVSWLYSRTRTVDRSALNSLYTDMNGDTINFFNLQDAAFGYYFPRISNQFGSSECVNLVGSRLEFISGAGQIGQAFTVLSGGSVDITARFARGFPIGSITWREPNGNIVTPSTPGYRITQGSGPSTLTIESVSESNIGQYTASSSNEFGSISRTSTVSIGVTLVPPTIDKGSPSTINTAGSGKIGELFKASVGDTITIIANDITGVGASTIVWERIPPGSIDYITINPPDGTYTSTQAQNAQGFTVSTLSFIVGSNTFGTYRVTATNIAGNDAAISPVGQAPRIDGRFTIIRVGEGESRTVAVGGQINIAEGASVSLTATDIEGQPTRTFYWYYRNKINGPYRPLSTSSSNIRRLVSGNVGTLEITNIDRLQYGDYLVQATNDFGDSANVTARVGGPPIIRVLTGTETDGEGEIGQDFQIPIDRRIRITACVIGGFPPAPPGNFEFRESNTVLGSVQQPSPNENCFIYEEGEFELTCGTTITARTRNDFGFSNVPESRITYPAPRIIRGTARCSQGSTQNSVQIGDQLCLYNLNSFDITCSVERINSPEFNFQWQYQASNISTVSGQYIVSRLNTMSTRLTVLNAGVNEVGRYSCTVNSVCGLADSVNTDVEHYSYRYDCNENGLLVCAQSRNGGAEISISTRDCEQLGLERPTCDRCEWEVSQWSACSDLTCHRGRRTRTVQCVCEGEVREGRDCQVRSSRPPSLDICGPRVRCNRPYEWRAYRFGTCSTTCGASYRQRRVECVSSITGSVASEADCVTLFKPPNRNRCFTRPCSNCIDNLPSDECRDFVTQVGGDCSKYFLWFDCCAACSSLA